MGEIHVNAAALAAGQEGINSKYKQLVDTLDRLESDLDPMVASWSGEAQNAYVAVKSQWRTAANDLATVLSIVADAVGQANMHYTEAEKSVRARWSGSSQPTSIV